MNLRRLLPALAVLAAALLAAGCGEKQDRTTSGSVQPLTVELDYQPNADHSGIYAALGAGTYRKAGLAVQLRVPGNPADPLKLLAAGKVDLAISYEPELMLARDKGLQLVAVGALVQTPLTSIMSLGSQHIRSPSDLKGKRVGTAGIPYQSAYLKTILGVAGVASNTVKETNIGFNLVPAMLSKKVDATLGAFWNYEGIELAQKGKKPDIIRMEQAGVPTYDELILVARRQDLTPKASQIRRFLQATARGYSAVKLDPESGIQWLLQAVPGLNKKLELASAKATASSYFPANPKRPWGWMEPTDWERYGAWMLRHRLVTSAPTPAALTNEFLPGEGI